MAIELKKIYLTTNGCIRRSFDLQRLSEYFKLNDCQLVKKPKLANYIIFITCSVKKNKEEQSLKLINKFKKYSGELIVGGCLPDIAPQKFKQNFKGKFFSSKNLNKIDEIFKDFKVKLADVPRNPVFETSSPFKDPLKLRIAKKIKSIKELINKQPNQFPHAYVSIGVGCLGECTYCSVKKAMEPFKSKPLNECLTEYQSLIDSGYRSFTIMSPDTGAYGLDINSSLPELLDKFSKIDQGLDVKWYVIDLKPSWVIKYQDGFIKHLKSNRIHHLLIPIQTASPRLLRLMKRCDDMQKIANTLREFKKVKPNLELRTHMMIGFPSETENNFQATLNFLKDVPFNHTDLLKYYEAEGTLSAKMKDKIPDEVAIQRIHSAVKFLDKHGISYDCDDI